MSEQLRKRIPPEFYQKHFLKAHLEIVYTKPYVQENGNRHKTHMIGIYNGVKSKGSMMSLNQEYQATKELITLDCTPKYAVSYIQFKLCRKDMLMKNIRKHKRVLAKQKRLVEDQWNFMPLTFFLPSQYIMFSEEFKKQGGLWIMKPVSRCQGSGIFLVDKLAKVAPFRFKKAMDKADANQTPQNNPTANFKAPTKQKQNINARKTGIAKTSTTNKTATAKQKVQTQQKSDSDSQEQPTAGNETQRDQQADKQTQIYIIQQYIEKPLLLGHKKFDLRIYVLCTNYGHLTVWLYRNGFARFTHEPYNTEDIENLQGHLTNVGIQKQSENYDQVRGGKWMLDKFKIYLISRFGVAKADKCFYQIQKMIIRSLEAVQKNILVSKSSFQLYGYDFMIDQKLKPWLIEVNGGPSMTASTEFDCRLKCGLIDDVLTIVDLEGFLTGQEMSVGDFDLIMSKGAHVKQSKHSQIKASLGWSSQRTKQYKRLAKQFMQRKLAEKQFSHQKSIMIEQSQKQNKETNPQAELNPTKKEKLLPSFYYKKKHTPQTDIDKSIKYFLQQQQKILTHNQNVQTKSLKYQNQIKQQEENQGEPSRQMKYFDAYFVPLKAMKVSVEEQ